MEKMVIVILVIFHNNFANKINLRNTIFWSSKRDDFNDPNCNRMAYFCNWKIQQQLLHLLTSFMEAGSLKGKRELKESWQDACICGVCILAGWCFHLFFSLQWLLCGTGLLILNDLKIAGVSSTNQSFTLEFHHQILFPGSLRKTQLRAPDIESKKDGSQTGRPWMVVITIWSQGVFRRRVGCNQLCFARESQWGKGGQVALVLTFRSVEMAQSDSSLRMEVATIPTYVYINMYIYIYAVFKKI